MGLTLAAHPCRQLGVQRAATRRTPLAQSAHGTFDAFHHGVHVSQGHITEDGAVVEDEGPRSPSPRQLCCPVCRRNICFAARKERVLKI